MRKPSRVVSVSVVSVLTLLCTPWLCSQEVGGKDPADKGVAEQKTVEKPPVHPFGERCDPTTCMTKVLYFSNLSQPNELQDVVNALRTTVDISRVQQLLFAQVLVVRGTPEQVASAEKLANELDMAKRRLGGAGYRLDFKIISESDGDQKPRSRIYSLVTEAHETAKLSIGGQLPAHSQSDDSSENKQSQSPDAIPGRSIESRIISENEPAIDLYVDVAFSGSATREPARNKIEDEKDGKDEKAGLKHRGSPEPAQLRFRDHVAVELGKPTIIAVLDDPDYERSFQIEVTASRVKEAP
jgi:hypothetical protein